MKLYDRNRNALNLGQRVMIAATGAVDFLKEAHTDNMTPIRRSMRSACCWQTPVSATPPSS